MIGALGKSRGAIPGRVQIRDTPPVIIELYVFVKISARPMHVVVPGGVVELKTPLLYHTVSRYRFSQRD